LFEAAIRSRKPELIAACVRLGADPDRVLDERGTTRLVQAIRSGRLPLVEALLAAGADANRAGEPALVRSHPLGALSYVDAYQSEARKQIFDRLIAAGASVHWAAFASGRISQLVLDAARTIELARDGEPPRSRS
jgi:hypothetical protein